MGADDEGVPHSQRPVYIGLGGAPEGEGLAADGISYVRLHFTLKDFTDEELGRANILCHLMGNVETQHFSVTELDSEIDENLGRFSIFSQVASGRGGYEPMVTLAMAVLPEHKADAVRLADEVMNRTLFKDEKYILNLLRQQRIESEQSIMMGGNSMAVRRADAMLCENGAVREAMQGISKLRLLQSEEKGFGKENLTWMEEMRRRIFSRDRLTVSLTGEMDESWLQALIGVLPDVPMGKPALHALMPRRAEGFLIPSEIGFAARCAMLTHEDRGALKVASQFLTLDYLWNTIRVKGGAYGTNLSATDSGPMEISSFRDPNAAGSLESFSKTAEALEEFLASDAELTQYIVSTIGSVDPLRTPRSVGPEADWMYFSGTRQEDLDREWTQILSCTRETLKDVAKAIRAACDDSVICVVGGQKSLDALKGKLDSVEAIQQ